jgi:hypothetical protein
VKRIIDAFDKVEQAEKQAKAEEEITYEKKNSRNNSNR